MPYPQDPHGTSYANTRTCEGGGTGWVYRPPGLSAREAFIAAYDRLRELAGAVQYPAVLAAVVDPYGRTVDSTLIASGHSLILGRHTRCGLRLLDEGFALRHLVAHARPGPPGAAPLIRLWDLHTWRAFITEDGQPCVAVTAQGLLFAALCGYSLLFVPTRGHAEFPWPSRAEDAWDLFPPRQFMEACPPEARLHRPRRAGADGQRQPTDVMREKPLLQLEDDRPPRNAWGAVRLVQDREEVEVPLSREHLEQGVLLGRYHRCNLRLEPTRISRVHLMLVLQGEELLAIDTASTHGTWHRGKKIGTVTLGPTDVLTLDRSHEVHWSRRSPDTTRGDG